MFPPHVIYLPRYLIQKWQYACKIILILVPWTSPLVRFHTLVNRFGDPRSRAGNKIDWFRTFPFSSRSKISVSRSTGYNQTIVRSGQCRPFFGGGSRPTEGAASIPLGAYLRAFRAYERNSLAPPLSSDATAILFPNPRSYGSVWLTTISSKTSTLCAVIYGDNCRLFVLLLVLKITHRTFSWKKFFIYFVAICIYNILIYKLFLSRYFY